MQADFRVPWYPSADGFLGGPEDFILNTFLVPKMLEDEKGDCTPVAPRCPGASEDDPRRDFHQS